MLRAGLAFILIASAMATPVLAEFEPHPDRVLCEGSTGYADSFDGRRTFLWRPEWLRAEKARLAGDDRARAALVKDADTALRGPLYSVTDKLKTPASGDRADYYSIGPYWWPTKGKPDGEPYSRRDGEVNPERDGEEFDKRRLTSFSRDVETLSLAAYMLDEDRYAARAAQLIRTWFLDPAARMNPNLNHGQAIPGRTTGRGEGIIDSTQLVPVVEAIGLIAPTGALSVEEQAALRVWFREYATWLATSDIGTSELQKQNNHGLWFDMFLTHFSLFAGLESVAKNVSESFLDSRIARQMGKDGHLPAELTRTRPFHYSHFAMGAAVRLATLAECVDIDLWTATTPDGRGLRRGMEFLLPYQATTESWPARRNDRDLADSKRLERARRTAAETFRIAAWGYDSPAYEAAAANYGDEGKDWLAPLTK
ncbi:MAG: alginate lyase family protein [Pacificimonas sp.]